LAVPALVIVLPFDNSSVPSLGPADGTIIVRRWQPATDLARLVEVTAAADVLFADHGLSLPPDDPTAELLRADNVLVAGSPAVGFAALITVDGRAHLSALADC
jgi:hypothetical protein